MTGPKAARSRGADDGGLAFCDAAALAAGGLLGGALLIGALLDGNELGGALDDAGAEAADEAPPEIEVLAALGVE